MRPPLFLAPLLALTLVVGGRSSTPDGRPQDAQRPVLPPDGAAGDVGARCQRDRSLDGPAEAAAFAEQSGDATPMACVLVEGGLVTEVYSPPLESA